MSPSMGEPIAAPGAMATEACGGAAHSHVGKDPQRFGTDLPFDLIN